MVALQLEYVCGGLSYRTTTEHNYGADAARVCLCVCACGAGIYECNVVVFMVCGFDLTEMQAGL